MAIEACVYVQERFAAVLMWRRSPISGMFELNVNLSSASRLSFIEYAHLSSSYLFAVGTGLIGRAAGLPTGSIIRLELTPNLTTTDYHRVAEARAAGVKAASVLHWKEGVVIEFVCSSEQELDTDAERQSRMLRTFANGFSTAETSASSVIAAHTILRQQMEATDADHMVAEVGPLSSVTPASSIRLKHIGEAYPSTSAPSLPDSDCTQSLLQAVQSLAPALA